MSCKYCDSTKLIAKGMCSKHYHRMRRHGHVELEVAERGSLASFVRAAARSDEQDCIEWPFPDDGKGYGQIYWEGTMHRAHRVSLHLATGVPLGNPLEAAHECGNRACVNPKHLAWKTAKENNADKRRHGTHGTKLSEDAAAHIKRSTAASKDLSAVHGVHVTQVNRIRSGSSWAHLCTLKT